MVIKELSNLKYWILTTLIEVAVILLHIIDEDNTAICILAIALNLVFLIKFRKHLAILLLFLFFTLYNYACVQGYFQNYYISAFRSFIDVHTINFVLLLNSLFIYTLGNVINRRHFGTPIYLDNESYKSKYLFWILVSAGCLIIQFGIRGDNILISGGYGKGVEKSSLHEYFLLVYLLILLVRPKGKLTGLVVAVMYFIYCIKTVLFGGRAEALEITVLCLLYFWLLPKRENKKLLIIIICIGLYVSNVVSMVRADPVSFFKGDYLTYLNPFHETEATLPSRKKTLANNQGDVIQSSGRMLALVRDGVLDNSTRVKSFVFMLLSVGVPYSMLPDYTNLSLYNQGQIYRSGGGGLISMYFYVWLGFAGPILIGLFLGYFINKGLSPRSNIAYKVYAVMLLVMYPRWYSYGPIIIFKICLWAVVLYIFSRYAFDIFFKRKTNPLLSAGVNNS